MKKYIFFILSFIVNSVHAYEIWDGKSWEKYRDIIIQENSGYDLEDYAILINVSYDDDMKPDFGDMRFAWYNSSCEEWYELPYWIENLVNYTHVDIWVKVPNIPANNQTKIRMYYGNNYAINRSNGYNVFYVFDDFEIYNSTNDLVKIWTNVS